jgi:hypothetical protein
MPMKKGQQEQRRDGEEGAAAFLRAAWYDPGRLQDAVGKRSNG